jgi:peptidoglycan/LPS O-acetylase OafA/YrhL
MVIHRLSRRFNAPLRAARWTTGIPTGQRCSDLRKRLLIVWSPTVNHGGTILFSLRTSDNDTSICLDFLRAIAAQMVCIGHGIVFFVPQMRATHLPIMQTVGVLLFFILSGFLISATLLERSRDPNYGFLQYFVERFARIYSGLVPALLFVAMVDTIASQFVNLQMPSTSYGWRTFVANLMMLEGYRGAFANLDIMQWPMFGTAAPLWTLVIEWHIYLFVGAVFFMGARPKTIPFLIPVAVLSGQVPGHYLFGAMQPDGLGTSLFLVWLGGAYLLLIARKVRPPYWIAVAISGSALIAYLAVVRAGTEYRLSTYPLLLLFVFGVVTASQQTRIITSPRIVTAIRFLAGYSFTLYLVHHTVMWVAFQLWPGSGWMVFTALVLLSNSVAAVMALATEMRHKQLAALLIGGAAKIGNRSGKKAALGETGR